MSLGVARSHAATRHIEDAVFQRSPHTTVAERATTTTRRPTHVAAAAVDVKQLRRMQHACRGATARHYCLGARHASVLTSAAPYQ